MVLKWKERSRKLRKKVYCPKNSMMGYVRIYISHVQFTYKLVITQYLAVDVCSFFLQSNSTKKNMQCLGSLLLVSWTQFSGSFPSLVALPCLVLKLLSFSSILARPNRNCLNPEELLCLLLASFGKWSHWDFECLERWEMTLLLRKAAEEPKSISSFSTVSTCPLWVNV